VVAVMIGPAIWSEWYLRTERTTKAQGDEGG
jgi:hypothetical protein